MQLRAGKRIYCSNLSFKSSWQDLKDLFRDVGNVVYANVMRDDTGEPALRTSSADGLAVWLLLAW